MEIERELKEREGWGRERAGGERERGGDLRERAEGARELDGRADGEG